jgi:hypothetical protein
MTTKSASRGVLAWAAIMLNLSACNGQPTIEGSANSVDTLAASSGMPQVDMRVNKHYDEHGNLIAYDSSYTSVCRSIRSDAAFMDSVFKDFMTGFGMRYPFLNDPGFNNLFFPDGSFHRDFFDRDLFRKRMEMNLQYMQRMMEQMDSLKNQHFLRPAPPERDGPGAGAQDVPAPQQQPRMNEQVQHGCVGITEL